MDLVENGERGGKGRRIDVEAKDEARRIERATNGIPSYSRVKSIKWGS